jgi:hypothetical protein
VKTRIPGENQNTWRKPEYQEKTIIPGDNIDLSFIKIGSISFSGFLQVFCLSPGTLVFTRYSGFLQVLWSSPDILVFARYSGFLQVF